MRVIIHIDRLALAGEIAEPAALAAALQRELAQVMAEPAALRPLLDAHGAQRLRGKFALTAAAPSADIGTAAARSMARGLRP